MRNSLGLSQEAQWLWRKCNVDKKLQLKINTPCVWPHALFCNEKSSYPACLARWLHFLTFGLNDGMLAEWWDQLVGSLKVFGFVDFKLMARLDLVLEVIFDTATLPLQQYVSTGNTAKSCDKFARTSRVHQSSGCHDKVSVFEAPLFQGDFLP